MGEGNLSIEINAKPITKPNAPHNLLILVNNGKIVITWQAPVDNGGASIINYRIYRGISPGNETYYTTLSNNSSYTDTNLVNGQTYYYRISAVNAMGESPWSLEVVAMVSISENGDQTFNLIIILLFGAVGLGVSGYSIYFHMRSERIKKKITGQLNTPRGKTASKSWKLGSTESFKGENQRKQLPLSTDWNKVLSPLEKEFAFALLNGISIEEPNILEDF